MCEYCVYVEGTGSRPQNTAEKQSEIEEEVRGSNAHDGCTFSVDMEQTHMYVSRTSRVFHPVYLRYPLPPPKGSPIDTNGYQSTEDVPVKPRLISWLIRTLLLALATIVIGWWRLSLNGGTGPQFRYNSNRHAIEPFPQRNPLPPELTVGPDDGVHGL